MTDPCHIEAVLELARDAQMVSWVSHVRTRCLMDSIRCAHPYPPWLMRSAVREAFENPDDYGACLETL